MAFVFFYYIDKKWTISLCGKRGKIFKKKNDDSFPINAIKDVLKQFRIKIKDIDFFAITSKTCPPASELIKSMSGWNVDDYLKQQNDYWYPRLVEKK